jgi:hypothetical protein
MSFKRSDLAALGIEPEKIQTLIDWHMETVSGLQAKIDENKDAADELAKVQAELAQVKKDLNTANKAIDTANKDDYKGKYETATAELEMLKSEFAAKETATAKKAALKAELKKENYSDRAVNLILRNGFADDVEIGEDGTATNLADVVKAIQADSDFSGFTPQVTETKVNLETPPANAGGKKALTWDDIDKIKDTDARQRAMAENMEALGIKK